MLSNFRLPTLLLLGAVAMIGHTQCVVDTRGIGRQSQVRNLRVEYYDTFGDYIDRNMYVGGTFPLHLDFPQLVGVKGIGETYAFNGDTIYVEQQGDKLSLRCNSKYAKEAERWQEYRKVKKGKTHTSLLLSYFQHNPTSWAALPYLDRAIRNQELPLDSAQLLFRTIDVELRQSRIGQGIAEHIRRQSNLVPGCSAPDFQTIAWRYDAEGNRISTEQLRLSDLRGKVVLMDFWASWCGPCRDGMKFVKKLHNELHPSGLEVLAVNSDLVNFDVAAWEKAIHQDGLHLFTHIQAAENRYFPKKGEVAYEYFVSAIPLYVVIDKRGIVRGSWLAHNKAQEQEMEKLIRQLVME